MWIQQILKNKERQLLSRRSGRRTHRSQAGQARNSLIPLLCITQAFNYLSFSFYLFLLSSYTLPFLLFSILKPIHPTNHPPNSSLVRVLISPPDKDKLRCILQNPQRHLPYFFLFLFFILFTFTHSHTYSFYHFFRESFFFK